MPSIVPLTRIRRDANGNVTVRSNVDITFRGSIPFNGSVSGTIPKGATFTGRDANNNNVPDVLERSVRNGSIRFGD